MELRPGYKKTEIGVIPEDWSVATLGSVARVFDGTHQTPKYVPTGIPFYSVEHVTSGDFQDTKFISEEEHRFLTRYVRIETGDVLMTRIGSIGDCILVDWNVNASYYVSLALLKFHSGVAGFFVHYSRLPSFKVEVDLHSLPSAIPKKINLGPISDIRFAFPPIQEQSAISDVLSDVDASIAALSRLIAKKRDLRKGAMQRLLTGQTRLPGFTAPWQEKRFGELAFVRSQKVAGAVLPTGTPCIELDQIASESGRLIATGTASITSVKNSFEPGDVLFGRLRAYLRKFWLADRKGVCSTEIWPLVPVEGQATSGFIFYTVQRSDFIDAATQSYGTHMPRSDWGVVKNFEVLAPRPDEQSAIAQTLSDMDGEIANLDERLDKTRAIKQAMMQALLTGRVRLPVRRNAAPQTKEAAHE